MELGKSLLDHPVELLPGVAETILTLRSAGCRLVLVTKGDLYHQEQKVARSGLVDAFERVEIVSEKDEATYRAVVERSGIQPAEFLMVGNTVRSDVLPVLAIGGRAVQVPYEITWSHEQAEHSGGFAVLERLSELPAWLGNRVSIEPPEALAGALAEMTGKKVSVDPALTSAWYFDQLAAAGAEAVRAADPTALPRACKNEVEIAGARSGRAGSEGQSETGGAN